MPTPSLFLVHNLSLSLLIFFLELSLAMKEKKNKYCETRKGKEASRNENKTRIDKRGMRKLEKVERNKIFSFFIKKKKEKGRNSN